VLPPSGSATLPPTDAEGVAGGAGNQAGQNAGEAAADDPIAAALARGDHAAALTSLMQGHGIQIHRFCVSMLGDQSLADDVHQAVFVQAYEGLAGFRSEGFRGEGTWRAWLFGIARHRCLDAARARKRWRWRFPLASDPASMPGRDAIADAAERAEHVEQAGANDPRSRALRDCLRTLAPHVRVAVLMRYEQGLSYDEIARMCRERAPAIQARVARALPVLRDCMVAKEMRL
jgi:RNA polymerase sigma factor (sigma-70 family)